MAGRVSPGGVILIMCASSIHDAAFTDIRSLLVLVVVYLVGGALFMRFGKGEPVGPELILFRGFWASIPALALVRLSPLSHT